MAEILRVRPDARLVLVGGGEVEDEIKAQVEDRGLGKAVHFSGRVPQSETAAYYSIMDLLVYPRRSMRLTELVTPLKPLEAMALGKVVVGSDVGGIRELVEDGVTGRLVPAGDVRSLARACISMIQDREEIGAMGVRARAGPSASAHGNGSCPGTTMCIVRQGLLSRDREPGERRHDNCKFQIGNWKSQSGRNAAKHSSYNFQFSIFNFQWFLMKILSFTTVYPNAAQPGAGVFVRERLRHAARLADVRVVAPVPWFPFGHRITPQTRPRLSSRIESGEMNVLHPRFFSVPGIFKALDGLFLFLSSVAAIRRLKREGFDFDLIDAHFAYPDGLAAILLGFLYRRPVVVTLRGRRSLCRPVCFGGSRSALS